LLECPSKCNQCKINQANNSLIDCMDCNADSKRNTTYKTLCPCNNGYYENINLDNYTCLPCMLNCLKCNSSVFCLTCINTYYFSMD
jgi:hypothetical protein